MRKFNFIVIALVLFVCFSEAAAQKRQKVSTPQQSKAAVTSRDVEVKEDKTSGKREVRLAKQNITRILTLELNDTIDLKAAAKNAGQWASEKVAITFAFAYGNGSFTESAFDFTVDGKQVEGGDVKRASGSLEDAQKERDIFTGIITVDSLEKIAGGSKVRLKLGSEVYDINQSAGKNIKAFVAALKRK